MLHIGSPKGYRSAVNDLKQQSESLVNKQVGSTTDLGNLGVPDIQHDQRAEMLCCNV